MPLFLLLLGALTSLVGLAIVALAVTMRDAFESDLVTPGTITAVGGLLLIGSGLIGMRFLRRREKNRDEGRVKVPAPGKTALVSPQIAAGQA